MSAALALNISPRPSMSDEVKQGLLDAYSHLMRPLVRILIRNGVAFGELAEAVKRVYVDTAADDFSLDSRKTSRSRVAILTGLTRKDVKRILDAKESDQIPPFVGVHRAARVLEGWHQDPDFTGPYGIPLELEFEGELICFSELVRRYSGDMPARAMLEELKRVKAVEETASGELKVLSRYYISSQLDPKNAKYFGDVVHDLAATLEHNFDIERGASPRFERWVTNDRLDQIGIARFHAMVTQLGQQFLERLDNWLSSNEISDDAAAAAANTKRIRVGVYFYEDRERKKSGGHK